MNLRFVICMVAAVGLIRVRARGDVTPVPPDVEITATAKASLNQTTFSDEVTQKVTAEVQKMAENAYDVGTVKMTRDWLIGQNPTNASGPYQQAYAAALNTAFMNVLGQGDPPVPFRVNAGIVISKLSGPKESLAPTVNKLLGDKCPAVVLWGEKAAQGIFPLAMQNANGPFNAAGGVGGKVIDAIVASLLAHLDGPLAGDIAGEAFKAVNPKLWDVKLTPAPAAMTMLVDANLKMQKARIDVYHNTGVPDNPLADTYASYMIFTAQVWPTMNPPQQQQAVQNAVDLTSLMGQRAASRAANQNQDSIGALKEEGRWIQQLGTILSDGNVQSAGHQINDLHPDMAGKSITDACDGAYQALSQNPTIQGWSPPLNQPPNLSAPSNAPAPTAKGGPDASTGSTPTSLAPQ